MRDSLGRALPTGPGMRVFFVSLALVAAALEAPACNRTHPTTSRVLTVAESLGIRYKRKTYGPYPYAAADSTFNALTAILDRALGKPGTCYRGVAASWNFPNGSIGLLEYGPDVMTQDTAAEKRKPQWGFVLAYDSTRSVLGGPCAA